MAATDPRPRRHEQPPADQRSEQAVKDRELERQGRRFGRSGGWFLLIGVLLAIPGVVLILIDHGWSVGVGIAVLLVASIPAIVGLALIASSAVSRWSARHRSFA